MSALDVDTYIHAPTHKRYYCRRSTGTQFSSALFYTDPELKGRGERLPFKDMLKSTFAISRDPIVPRNPVDRYSSREPLSTTGRGPLRAIHPSTPPAAPSRPSLDYTSPSRAIDTDYSRRSDPQPRYPSIVRRASASSVSYEYKKFPCPVCNVAYFDFEMAAHTDKCAQTVETVEPLTGKTVECPICKELFTDREIQTHFNTHPLEPAADLPSTAPTSSASPSPATTSTVAVATGSKSSFSGDFQCPLCTQSFFTQRSLEFHVHYDHKEATPPVRRHSSASPLRDANSSSSRADPLSRTSLLERTCAGCKQPFFSEMEYITHISTCKSALQGPPPERFVRDNFGPRQQDAAPPGEGTGVTHLQRWPAATLRNAELLSGQWRGIQGENNSCYMDSMLFSMFAFTDVFDALLQPEGEVLVGKGKGDGGPHSRERACELMRRLRNQVVGPLRQHMFVPAATMDGWRRILNGLWKDAKNDPSEGPCEEADSLDFFSTLHDIALPSAQAALWYTRKNTEERARYLTVPPRAADRHTGGNDEARFQIPTLQELIDSMAEEEQIRVLHDPNVLVLQVPRQHHDHTYDRIIPNLRLSLQALHGRADMELFAVLSIGKSHFVSFNRVRSVEGDVVWLFFDSMSDSSESGAVPNLTVCPMLENELSSPDQLRQRVASELVTKVGPRRYRHMETGVSQDAKRLLEDVYICMYRRV